MVKKINKNIEEGQAVPIKKSRHSKVEKNVEALETNDTQIGVVYIGHLPWGFDENGIKKYFEQFGKINKVLIPRSKNTGRVKGYGFVEFDDKEVSEVAAKTMNNYILFDKILKCSVVQDTSKYNQLFKKWKKKFVFADKYKKYLLEKNKPKSTQEMKEYVTNLLNKEEEKRKKLNEMGLIYDFPGFKAIIDCQNKQKTKKLKK